jgi:hypothetical protein
VPSRPASARLEEEGDEEKEDEPPADPGSRLGSAANLPGAVEEHGSDSDSEYEEYKLPSKKEEKEQEEEKKPEPVVEEEDDDYD